MVWPRARCGSPGNTRAGRTWSGIWAQAGDLLRWVTGQKLPYYTQAHERTLHRRTLWLLRFGARAKRISVLLGQGSDMAVFVDDGSRGA